MQTNAIILPPHLGVTGAYELRAWSNNRVGPMVLASGFDLDGLHYYASLHGLVVLSA